MWSSKKPLDMSNSAKAEKLQGDGKAEIHRESCIWSEDDSLEVNYIKNIIDMFFKNKRVFED